MGDLAGLFADLWNTFLEKDALDRLALAIGIVFPIASAAGTLTVHQRGK